MVLMIIKSIFRRYERWNPVHPTYGAFWGMGIGLGCGVGWGPGFGPDVIGYVGSGCGIGFSVGMTLAGFGIGLPVNSVFMFPYNAAMATRKGALDLFAGSNNIAPQFAALQKQVGGKFLDFNRNIFLENRVDLDGFKTLPVNVLKEAGRFGNHLLHGCKGLKDRQGGCPSAT